MLVDRLEAVVNSGFRIAMTGRVAVDEQEVMDVLDLMRTTIPDEIKQARRITQEREKLLAQAQTEANRIISKAEEQAHRMVADDNVVIMAQEQARQLLDDARRDSQDIRQEADEYALDQLDRLDRELQRITGGVRHAIDALSASVPGQADDQ